MGSSPRYLLLSLIFIIIIFMFTIILFVYFSITIYFYIYIFTESLVAYLQQVIFAATNSHSTQFNSKDSCFLVKQTKRNTGLLIFVNM